MEPPPAYEPSPVRPAVVIVQKQYTCCFGAIPVMTGSIIITIFCLFAAVEIPAVIVKVQNDEGNTVPVVLKLDRFALGAGAFVLFCGLCLEGDACCGYTFVILFGYSGSRIVISFISMAQKYENSSTLLYGHAFFFTIIIVWCITVVCDLISYYESRRESNQ